LIEKLFVNKVANQEGIYRVRLCKNGEWQQVTVDDYFPCTESGVPVFTVTEGNDLWIMILEKAFAKLAGSYLALRGGFAHEGLQDLTGCPTIYLDL
jgi:calpain-15